MLRKGFCGPCEGMKKVGEHGEVHVEEDFQSVLREEVKINSLRRDVNTE